MGMEKTQTNITEIKMIRMTKEMAVVNQVILTILGTAKDTVTLKPILRVKQLIPIRKAQVKRESKARTMIMQSLLQRKPRNERLEFLY
jgi:hypothetical protein